MKRFIFFLALTLPTTNKIFCQIEGMVADQKKAGISSAIIIATDSSGKNIDTVRSDIRGSYAFKGLKIGKYKIEANSPGFLKAVYNNIEVTPAPEGTDEGDDTYWAIRLDIKLIKVNEQKQ